MARAVGIDLGTTNSVVAVLEGGEPTVIANSEGSRTTPSIVAFAKNGEILVGQPAKNQAVTNVDRTIRSVKRHLGSDWKTEIDGKKYTAQEISARVLMKLKRDAESYLGEEITDAVITVPAYFEDAQRQATKEAGQIAGLNVLRIVNEPTAAALAYGLDKGEKEQTILVFDLGGGTFDVSLMEIGDGVVEVRATSGDNHLCGDDWDQRIVDWLVDNFKQSSGIDLNKDKMALQRIREAAEKAKIELSSSNSATINLPYITVDADKNQMLLDETLTRAEFKRITKDVLDRTRPPSNTVIKDASITTKPSEIFSTADDGQTTVGIQVFQGEREIAIHNKKLGTFDLTGIPPAPRGVPQIEVTFDIDANGIVHVNAKDLGTGKEQSIQITASSGLSKDEVERMVKEATLHAEEDKKKRELVDARNQLDGLVYQTEKTLGEQSATLDAATRGNVESALADAKKALESQDTTRIRGATDVLGRASHKLAEALYAKASQAGKSGEAPPRGDGAAPEGKGKDDVVEAEFEEVKE